MADILNEATIEFIKGKDGKWRWRATDSTGNIRAVGTDGKATKEECHEDWKWCMLYNWKVYDSK